VPKIILARENDVSVLMLSIAWNFTP